MHASTRRPTCWAPQDAGVFFTVTLPGARYGLISAAARGRSRCVMTDFGIAKVIGGNYNVLATDVYKQVIGQQDFSDGGRGRHGTAGAGGARLPGRPAGPEEAGGAAHRARSAAAGARGREFARDRLLSALFCVLVSAAILAILGMAIWGSPMQSIWPYNLSLALDNYDFAKFDANGWDSYWNSVRHGAGGGGLRHGADVYGRLAEREDARLRVDARRRAVPRLPADGGARPRAGPGLHLLLQRAQQPAQLPVRHHGDPGA